MNRILFHWYVQNLRKLPGGMPDSALKEGNKKFNSLLWQTYLKHFVITKAVLLQTFTDKKTIEIEDSFWKYNFSKISMPISSIIHFSYLQHETIFLKFVCYIFGQFFNFKHVHFCQDFQSFYRSLKKNYLV